MTGRQIFISEFAEHVAAEATEHKKIACEGTQFANLSKACPLKSPDVKQEACAIPYDKETLDSLRAHYQSTHAFRRQGNTILVFSPDGRYPVSGKTESISLSDNYDLFCFLVKEGLVRHLSSMGRHTTGFNPIELVSTKSKDNLLARIIPEDYPFQIRVQYKIDTRLIRGKPCLIIDCSTRKTLSENGAYFLAKDFDLTGRNVAVE